MQLNKTKNIFFLAPAYCSVLWAYW